jgi:hypothetical protein
MLIISRKTDAQENVYFLLTLVSSADPALLTPFPAPATDPPFPELVPAPQDLEVGGGLVVFETDCSWI